MAKIILLSVDRTLAQRTDDAAADRAAIVLTQSLEPDMLEGPAIIVIDHAAIPPERSLATAVGHVVENAGGRPVVLATDEKDADQILQAVRAGASDIIPRSVEPADIARILSRLLNGAAAGQGGGRLTLITGVDQEASAMAATDMAISRALEGSSTLLIDCTMPTSAAQSYLDLPVSYGMASAIADIDRLDASLLASALARHDASGLMLLTLDGGTGAEPAGVSPADIAALVRLLRSCCDDVILCTGSLRHGGLLSQLAALADQISLLCAQSIRELEASRRLINRLGADAVKARTGLMIWDHQPAVLLDSRRMADVLGLATVMPVPIDRARTRDALNAGRPLAMESDGGAYMQAIRRACGIKSGQRRGVLGTIEGIGQMIRSRRDRAA